MANSNQSPAELRSMFGANLRTLAAEFSSISDLSRQLGINRTQFNRYLSGESFPRPDVLARICSFFSVDARVLLEPVSEITSTEDPIANPFLRNYVGMGAKDVPPDMFPNGFFRFSRRSFVTDNTFVVGLVYVTRKGANTFLRGYETKTAMALQDLQTDPKSREFRGIVIQQEDGISIIASRSNSMTCSFNYLNRVASFQNNFWSGYVTRTVSESLGGLRATRLVYEHLGNDMKSVLPCARQLGFCDDTGLPPYHRRLLRPEVPFA